MTWRIEQHDVSVTPWPIESESVQCVCTSPPYWGLRDYGADGQIGLESTPAEYVDRIVAVFREVNRVLRKDGTVWLNLGDCYAGGNYRGGGVENATKKQRSNAGTVDFMRSQANVPPGLKPKDLVGIPWRVAFALQADGWWLRSDIVWAKPNPMPESIRDRPTRAHEYVFLLTKSRKYFYDADAIREAATDSNVHRFAAKLRHGTTYSDKSIPGAALVESPYVRQAKYGGLPGMGTNFGSDEPISRNARTVWQIATEPFPEAHFATFPTELARRCILAGSKQGDLVLDPFSGAGTVALVADTLGRDAIGLELNPEYVEMSRRRLEAPRTEEGKTQAAMEADGQIPMVLNAVR